MIASDETTPLLGESTPTDSSPSQSRRPVGGRVHFLDNLRAALTVLLILHHAAIFASLDSIGTPNYNKFNILPFALFITTNKSYLYATFFFVSGYSIHLGLERKSDFAFFLSRTLKTGLPALLWLEFARKLVIKGLVLFFGRNAFGRFGLFGSELWGGQLEGPGSYVFTLLIFDCTYLFSRLAGRHWSAVSFARLEAQIKASRTPVLSVLALSALLVAGVTVGNCFGLRLIPFIHRRHFPFEFPGFGAPVIYIVAYIAGVNFPIVQQYILIARPHLAAALLCGAEAGAYLTLGIAQTLSGALWDFTRATTDSEGARYFVDAGWNAHTVFFSVWSVFVSFIVPITFVSVFAGVPVLRRNLDVWTAHTYIQTYIHMVPVALAGHYMVRWDINRVPVVNALLGALAGVLVSWAVAILYVLLRRKYAGFDVQVSIRRRDVEAAEE